MKAEEKKRLEEVLKGTSFEDYDYGEFETADDLIEDFQERIREEDIIYYYKAMKYLKENDSSLNESMTLASEMGYTCENINSELLATLLYQQNLVEELSDLTNDIEEVFEEV